MRVLQATPTTMETTNNSNMNQESKEINKDFNQDPNCVKKILRILIKTFTATISVLILNLILFISAPDKTDFSYGESYASLKVWKFEEPLNTYECFTTYTAYYTEYFLESIYHIVGIPMKKRVLNVDTTLYSYLEHKKHWLPESAKVRIEEMKQLEYLPVPAKP